ncbi:MAG TPA: spermidine/putrescine ABC transporter substrate-binding protein [Spirochaetota bacterium]|nr:spermidine/putrescine ABC transporter substrate-binding protein [Spirochaetota bacterium]HPS85528.1 spermidine/putrescine ABC transporter substrate-binding protein [Spirochaetota bacterium]
MKKFIFAVISILLVSLSAASCSKGKETLHIYNWADYMNPAVITKFEQKYNCTVVMNYFDSNEALYAKLKAGASGYDILFPSGYMAKIMYEQKMIKEIDHSKLKNIKNLDMPFIKKALDPELKYSVPYMVTYCGIAYNKKKVKNFRPSWSMYDRTDIAGRMTLLNDLREVIGAALKFNGYKYNTVNDTELAKAKETVIRWKKNIAKFDVDEAKRGLSSGEFFLIQVYNGDAIQLMSENPDIAFALPEEGTSISQDDFVIPESSKNTDLAYKFIDFLLEPENAKDNMEFVYYLSPNLEAQKLMSKEFMTDPAINPPASVLKKCDYLMDLGENNMKYSELWDKIKSEK